MAYPKIREMGIYFNKNLWLLCNWKLNFAIELCEVGGICDLEFLFIALMVVLTYKSIVLYNNDLIAKHTIY
jgi:hypothetical protein